MVGKFAHSNELEMNYPTNDSLSSSPSNGNLIHNFQNLPSPSSIKNFGDIFETKSKRKYLFNECFFLYLFRDIFFYHY